MTSFDDQAIDFLAGRLDVDAADRFVDSLASPEHAESFAELVQIRDALSEVPQAPPRASRTARVLVVAASLAAAIVVGITLLPSEPEGNVAAPVAANDAAEVVPVWVELASEGDNLFVEPEQPIDDEVPDWLSLAVADDLFDAIDHSPIGGGDVL